MSDNTETNEIIKLIEGKYDQEEGLARILINFCCPQDDRQDERLLESCAKRFREFLIKCAFRVIENRYEEKEDDDIRIYINWGGIMYMHVALYARFMVENFVTALEYFSTKEGKLKIKNGELFFVINEPL